MSDELTDDQVNEIRDQLQSGRKLAAIKLYKNWTGSSLLAAKNYVEDMQASGGHPPASDFGNELPSDQMDRILDAIQGGRKLEAIKIYKESTGQSLLDCKNFIEKLMKELAIEDPGSVSSGSGCSSVILLAITLTAGAVLTMT